MSILLYSDRETLATQIAQQIDDGLSVLLTVGESELGELLSQSIEELLVVDVTGPKLNRLNFDVVSLAIIDLTDAELLSGGGRRLIDVLGRLSNESLTLAFYGSATSVTGSLLQDGISAGLNLVHRCVILPDLPATPDLNNLLASLSHTNVRLLALDAPVCARYDWRADTVAAQGNGSLLLTTFRQNDEGAPTVRVQMLSDGMTSTSRRK